jgi:uncharacterized protein (TIGR02444 family)
MPDWSSAGAPTRTCSAAVTTGESRFWTFSLAVYADAAVQQECLALQDDHGVDVNLLLFCAFVGAVHGVILSERATRDAADVVGIWQKDVVGALRLARRALKPFAGETESRDMPAADLRARVKNAELDAERIEQAMLEHWAAAHIGAHVGSWPHAEPADAVVQNIRTLLAVAGRTEGTTEGPATWPRHLIAAALATAGR